MVILAINMGEEVKEVQKFADDMGIKFPVIIDNTGDFVTLFQVRVRPTSVFINKEGVVTNIIQGLVTPEALKREFSIALK